MIEWALKACHLIGYGAILTGWVVIFFLSLMLMAGVGMVFIKLGKGKGIGFVYKLIEVMKLIQKVEEDWWHRYTAIPYLVMLPGAVVATLVQQEFVFHEPDTNPAIVAIHLLSLGCYANLTWKRFKERKNKKKRGAKVLAKVVEKVGKLVVIQVPAGARA